jgi:RNA polymerase sigma factor (sigma-70 family)
MPPAHASTILAHRDALLAFIRSRGVPEPDAEDILQESLLRALRHAPDLRDEDRLAPWLYQIVRNAIADHFRQRGREREQAAPLAPDETAAPEAALDTLCQCFRPLLADMHAAYAEVIELVDLQGEPPAGAAARLGISRDNLKVRLHRARRQLRDLLEQTCRTCAEHGCLDCSCRQAPASEPQ